MPEAGALRAFAIGLSTGAVSDAQAGAFAMAVCLNGLGEEGRVALTTGMRDSGDVLAWDLPGPVLDKHSTGGVGDCVSLILAPALAACGVYVPMISGRGLGHTGGTLDKLEAIPGVKTDVDEARLRTIVGQVGCAIVGATGQIAPADKRLYAIRDISATVSSVDLITASILSKKLAAGLDGLILDVKCGSGAFMKTPAEAEALARALVTTANGAGCATRALVSDMSQPLAPALGNALEVAVCMKVMAGDRAAASRLYDLTVALGAEVLHIAGHQAGETQMRAAIDTGAALDKFSQMIRAMGGPPDMAEDWRAHLRAAPVGIDVMAPADGVVSAIDGEALGKVVVALGGGRRVESDRIDPRVGLSDVVSLGDPVMTGQRLARVNAADDAAAERAAQDVLAAITLGRANPDSPLILKRIP